MHFEPGGVIFRDRLTVGERAGGNARTDPCPSPCRSLRLLRPDLLTHGWTRSDGSHAMVQAGL
jgi:hypothetical protein